MKKDNKIARSTNWKTSSFPSQYSTLYFCRDFTINQMKQIENGVIPQQMEDKWFIYFENEILYLHRSWTGFCIYKAHFHKSDKSYKLTHAEVNRNTKQYSEIDDIYEQNMLMYLINVLLLRERTDFPSKTNITEKRAIEEWNQIGRVMLGEYPKQ